MSKSRATGTQAETAVVRYLQNWWPAAERRALSGNKDKGDIAGIPGVVIEVKAAQRQELAAWQRETLAERGNALAAACVLIVKRPYKAVERWDAYLPVGQVYLAMPRAGILRDGSWAEPHPDRAPKEDLGWVRMDVALAVAFLREMSM